MAGCWCQQIPLTEKVRVELRQEFGNCLCRRCLEARAQPAGSD